MNSHNNTSKALWLSAGNIARATIEVDAIILALEHELEEYKNTFFYKSFGEQHVLATEYISSSYYFWGELYKSKDHKKSFGWLTYGFSLWRREDEAYNGTEWDGARDAKIYVGYGPSRDGGWEDSDMFVRGDGTGVDDLCEPVTSYLWEYSEAETPKPREWKDRSWFYVLPMCSVNNMDDILQKLISPVFDLLDEKEVKWDPVGAYKFGD